MHFINIYIYKSLKKPYSDFQGPNFTVSNEKSGQCKQMFSVVKSVPMNITVTFYLSTISCCKTIKMMYDNH